MEVEKIEDRRWCVYMHTNKINGKKYVGITSLRPQERWKRGLSYKGCVAFQNALNVYGWENFDHIILFDGLTEFEAKEKETSLIAEMDLRNPNNGYNISPGGDAFFKGGHHTDETKKMLSELRSGSGNPMYGKPRPDGGGKAPMKVINLNTLNVYDSQHDGERDVGACLGALTEVISGKRISLLGDYWMAYDEYLELSKSLSLEEIRNQFDERVKEHWKKAAANKRKPVVQLSLDGKLIKIFESIMEAERITGINHSAISRCCRHLQETAGNFCWVYYKDYNETLVYKIS